MPNFPSIYLELQELWKRLRGSAADISGLENRITVTENDITTLDNRVDSIESDIADGIAVETQSPNILGNGLLTNKIRLSDNININSVTSSIITASNVIVLNDISVIGTASIGMLNTVNQTSLQIGDKYITILSGASTHALMNGAGILYGSGSIDSTTGDQSSVAHLVYRSGTLGDLTSDYLEAYPGLRVSGSLTSSGNVYVPQLTASQNIRIQNLPASSETNVVVVDDNGILGKSNLSTIGGSDLNPAGSKLYYTPGTHYFDISAEIPSTAKKIRIVCISGGGGGGSGHTSGKYGTGGGGGGYSEAVYNLDDIRNIVLKCFVGSGGTGGNANSTPGNGNAGQNTIVEKSGSSPAERFCTTIGGRGGLRTDVAYTQVSGGTGVYNGGDSVYNDSVIIEEWR